MEPRPAVRQALNPQRDSLRGFNGKFFRCSKCNAVLRPNPPKCPDDKAVEFIHWTDAGIVWPFCNENCRNDFAKLLGNNQLPDHSVRKLIGRAYPIQYYEKMKQSLLRRDKGNYGGPGEIIKPYGG